MKRKVIFLDRDGTINVDPPQGYAHRIADFAFEEGAREGLKLLQSMGFSLTIVTGQSGIGRGFYTEDDFANFQRHLLAELALDGIQIDHTYFCPHHPTQALPPYRVDCRCRKPGIALIERAIHDYQLDGIEVDLAASFVIGDKTDDGMMGNRAGCRSLLVTTKSGKKGLDGHFNCRWDGSFPNLLKAAEWIQEQLCSL
ncbi:MAG: D-glycero-beta-D-manno-heptose,7-bisphosphate 7-phosphatase [Chlamydiales bacterium]|jgi:D-glycero-D-manno-heptose 1,7-bisphosphate phosphatase|nr:D-glycero-beta-D-manno-heptose,7-bisphosphate 7-phosphatase [Chlamydiales bacterium]